jgi:hypothetical protein
MIRILTFIAFSLLFFSCSKYEKDYHDNGKVKMKYQLDENGNWIGDVKQFYESGELEFECYYVSGVPEGLARFYYETGVLRLTKPYSMGIIDGNAQWYDSLGNLSYSELYSNDTLINCYWYNEKGKVVNGLECLDDSFTPQIEDFKILFSHRQDTFKIGERTKIDIRHDSILPYQIKLEFTNGRMEYKVKHDSFKYTFTPRRKGNSYMQVFVKYDLKKTKYVGILEYPVIE